MATTVDLLIVGSGAAGSLLASKMAQAGKQVLILEAGPAYVTDDLWSSQIWSRRLHAFGSPQLTGGADPLALNVNNGSGAGGSALHHYACWMRLHPEDFQFKTKYGQGIDWPIGYDDLRPYYDRIQRDVGISGDTKADIWRPASAPYPQPPLPILDQGKILKRGFDAMKIATAPTPQAILSRQLGDRAACILDGWCDAGCPIGALANPLVTYLKKALAAKAQIHYNAHVSRVLTDSGGKRATGVEYIDETGVPQTVDAKVVALGAYAIENPRILLTSTSSSHPNGLANSSGLVGCYMMEHVGGAIYGLFKEETKPYMGRSGGEIYSQEQYASNADKNGYVGGYQWLGATASKPNDLFGIAMTRPDLFGKPLDDFLVKATHHLATLAFIGHDLPVKENRITLSKQLDAFGLPIAQAAHSFSDDAKKLKSAGLARGQEIVQAAGATDAWVNPNANQHILGGVIMGTDPKTSVTNSYGQTHDLPNLFVMGSSLFPTSGAVNPTFTIHAVTLRTADYLIKEWQRIA